jgi:hypothetical protein
MNNNTRRHRHRMAKDFSRGINPVSYKRLYTMPQSRIVEREFVFPMGFQPRKSHRPKVAGKKFIRNTVDTEETSGTMSSVLGKN